MMRKTTSIVLEDHSVKQPANCFIAGEIWTSRRDLCSARVRNHERNVFGISNGKKIIADISWNDEDIGPNDFIFARYVRLPTGDNKVPRKERYELLAGSRLPDWAEFPAAWARWVGAMQEEATQWLADWAAKQEDPEAIRRILATKSVTTKKGQWRAWKAVEDHLRSVGHINRPFKHRKTWTSVAAMPVKFALALGWVPSSPRPRWVRKREGFCVMRSNTMRARRSGGTNND